MARCRSGDLAALVIYDVLKAMELADPMSVAVLPPASTAAWSNSACDGRRRRRSVVVRTTIKPPSPTYLQNRTWRKCYTVFNLNPCAALHAKAAAGQELSS